MSTSPPAGFSGDWITADDADYPKAIARWAANAQRRAKVVAFVKSEADVGLALAFAKAAHLPLAVRGGGHSAAGASSSEGGIVIDLSRYFADVRVDAEEKLAYVGGGAVWKTVDKAAIEHGLATVGGTVNHTGVGGLTLGGGYGYLTGQHGLALDNLVQATVVTADEQVRTVSATETPDLYWGIRGGGGNFGVVTQFVLQLHPQRRTVFAGTVMYPYTDLTRVNRAISDWWKNASEKEAIIHGVMRGPDGSPVTMVILFCNGSGEEGRKRFKDLFDLRPALDMAREIPYEVLNTLQNHNAPYGRNYFMKGIFTSGPRVGLPEAVLERICALSDADLDQRFAVFFEYIPSAKVLAVPNNATAHVRGSRVSTLVFGAWDDSVEATLPVVRASANDIIDTILKSETDIASEANTGYGNYIADEPVTGSGSRASAEKLFGENYPRLQQLKKKYDPANLFSKWAPIVPAP
ncbi:FAD-binding domain-containing protein [Auriscalpium vulgare]|uniref:FAD-binding domain-containing protein n=1 Tax=Auriscalpium vulgare TaxID=40419 RepID=A0ACB8S9E3_9AGAM|nr:FAD-binding domain-containing protein [Auriscalpium vulgare]